MFLVQGVVYSRAAADILKNRNFSHTWTYSAPSVRHAITRQKDSLIFTLWGISHKGNLTIANQRIYRQASSSKSDDATAGQPVRERASNVLTVMAARAPLSQYQLHPITPSSCCMQMYEQGSLQP
jgi:hypothetical protein